MASKQSVRQSVSQAGSTTLHNGFLLFGTHYNPLNPPSVLYTFFVIPQIPKSLSRTLTRVLAPVPAPVLVSEPAAAAAAAADDDDDPIPVRAFPNVRGILIEAVAIEIRDRTRSSGYVDTV